MRLEYLKNTLTICVEYHERNGNKEKAKELKKRIANLPKK